MATHSDKTWPIILFAIPFAAVVVGIAMVIIAVYYPDDVVVDDYYKDGMAINQQLEEDRRADMLGIKASLELATENSLVWHIPDASEPALTLDLYHVTSKGEDRRFVLVNNGSNGFSVEHDDLDVLQKPGVWYLEISSAERNWRLRSRVITPLTTLELE